MSFLLFLLGITSEWRNELEIFCMQEIVAAAVAVAVAVAVVAVAVASGCDCCLL